MSKLSRDEWLNLGRKNRAGITSALLDAKMPLIGWVNELPEFKDGFKPDWNEIDKIAQSVTNKPIIKKKAKIATRSKKK